jgi:hypothetical protein
VQVGADHLVNLFVGVGNPAGQLVDRQPPGEERKRLRILVAGLFLRLGIVDRAAVQVLKRAT